MRFLILLIISAFSSSAFAQDSFQPSLEEFFYVGASFGSKIDSESSFGTVKTSATDKGKGAIALGADLSLNLSEHFGGSIIFDFSQFDTGELDDLYFLGIAPRARVQQGRLTAWTSLGLGAAVFKHGKTRNQQSNGDILEFSKDRAVAFGLSPRVGLDIKLVEQVSLRLQLTYTQADFSNEFTYRQYPNLNNSISGNTDFTVSWYTGTLGISARF